MLQKHVEHRSNHIAFL